MTLRNSIDLLEFEVFLNKLIKLLSISPTDFTQVVNTCPVAYWDKIDDLRETSLKHKRDSDEFIRCLEKSKKYHSLILIQ